MGYDKKRYLMIVEKPSDVQLLTNIYHKIEQQVPYILDVVVANNHVIDIRDGFFRNKIEIERLEKLEPVHLKSKRVDDWFRIFDNEHYQKNGKMISALVHNYLYDVIINACNDNEEGELAFEYTIESLHLESYPTKRIITQKENELSLTQKLLMLS